MSKNNNKLIIGFVCFLIGLMVAILFNSKQTPSERDTRDTWEIRTALLQEQKDQQKLYKEIEDEEQILLEYHTKTEHQQINALKDSIDQLKMEAGLTNKEDKGVVLTLQPLFSDDDYQEYPRLNAELLQHFINELNAFGAKDIAIGEQRIIDTTPIRDVNEKVYVNHTAISDLPIEVHILTDEQTQLINHIEVSEVSDYFALENISINIEEKSKITLPKYEGSINFNELDVVEVEEGEQ